MNRRKSAAFAFQTTLLFIPLFCFLFGCTENQPPKEIQQLHIGFFITTAASPTDSPKDGSPFLKGEENLVTYDLNFALPGGPTSESRDFYIFGSVDEGSVAIEAIDIGGQDKGDFRIALQDGVTLPKTLGKWEHFKFKVIFSPVTKGKKSATIRIQADGTLHDMFRVQGNAIPNSAEVSVFNQYGFEAFNIHGLPSGGRDAALAASAMPFQMGGCPPAYSNRVSITVKNIGPGVLEVSEVTLSENDNAKFSLSTDDHPITQPFVIAPGGQIVINATLGATDVGYYWARINFVSNDQNEPQYKIGIWHYRPKPKGCIAFRPYEVGVEIPIPPLDQTMEPFDYDLGDITVGTTRDLNLAAINRGNAPVTLSGNSVYFPESWSNTPLPNSCKGEGIQYNVDLNHNGDPEVDIQPNQVHTLKISIVVPHCLQDLGNLLPLRREPLTPLFHQEEYRQPMGVFGQLFHQSQPARPVGVFNCTIVPSLRLP